MSATERFDVTKDTLFQMMVDLMSRDAYKSAVERRLHELDEQQRMIEQAQYVPVQVSCHE